MRTIFSLVIISLFISENLNAQLNIQEINVSPIIVAGEKIGMIELNQTSFKTIESILGHNHKRIKSYYGNVECGGTSKRKLFLTERRVYENLGLQINLSGPNSILKRKNKWIPYLIFAGEKSHAITERGIIVGQSELAEVLLAYGVDSIFVEEENLYLDYENLGISFLFEYSGNLQKGISRSKEIGLEIIQNQYFDLKVKEIAIYSPMR